MDLVDHGHHERSDQQQNGDRTGAQYDR